MAFKIYFRKILGEFILQLLTHAFQKLLNKWFDRRKVIFYCLFVSLEIFKAHISDETLDTLFSSYVNYFFQDVAADSRFESLS